MLTILLKLRNNKFNKIWSQIYTKKFKKCVNNYRLLEEKNILRIQNFEFKELTSILKKDSLKDL